MPRFQDIRQFTIARYQANVHWGDLEKKLAQFAASARGGFDLSPDFQRGHVWTPEQQSRYIEFILSNGQSGRTVYFNCPGWMGDFSGPMVLVDGLQRITAVRRFLAGEIPAFGATHPEYRDGLPLHAEFLFCINNLKTRAEVLRWYVDLNAGGVVHAPEEIDRVRRMIDAETKG